MSLFIFVVIALLSNSLLSAVRSTSNTLQFLRPLHNQLLHLKGKVVKSIKQLAYSRDDRKRIGYDSLRSKHGVFVINGWRWHMMSVIRDVDRFSTVIQSMVKDSSSYQQENRTKQIKRIGMCYHFVCQFNWDALLRVERDIFVPFLADILPTGSQSLIYGIKNHHSAIHSLSAKLGNVQNMLALSNQNKLSQIEFICKLNTMQNLLERMKTELIQMQTAQETKFVPYIATHVSEANQVLFNRKVVPTLGLFDSQIHLVSMREAIKGLPEEENIFKLEIPKTIQALLPLWKSTLYMPKTLCLEHHLK